MEKEWDHANGDNDEEEEELQQPGYIAYVQCSFCTTILLVPYILFPTLIPTELIH